MSQDTRAAARPHARNHANGSGGRSPSLATAMQRTLPARRRAAPYTPLSNSRSPRCRFSLNDGEPRHQRPRRPTRRWLRLPPMPPPPCAREPRATALARLRASPRRSGKRSPRDDKQASVVTPRRSCLSRKAALTKRGLLVSSPLVKQASRARVRRRSLVVRGGRAEPSDLGARFRGMQKGGSVQLRFRG
jgi:hypothetical protein